MPSSLYDVFHAFAEVGAGGLESGELEAVLHAHLTAAQAAWPDLKLSHEAYVQFVAERCGSRGLAPVTLAPDLWLACACARGDAMAHERFYASFEPVAKRVLLRRGAPGHDLSDIKQVLFEKILLPVGESRPKIAEYRGLGPLKSWVATVTATSLLMARRAERRRREEPSPDDEPIAQSVLGRDPELAYLKSRYRGSVEAGFVTAIAQLHDRERVLLRLHLVERMSIDRLGAMYGVNRTTAARWLAKARERLLHATRAELRRRLSVTDRQCDSILKLVQSQLDISFARHLQP